MNFHEAFKYMMQGKTCIVEGIKYRMSGKYRTQLQSRDQKMTEDNDDWENRNLIGYLLHTFALDSWEVIDETN
jgi:hypothetical protein